MASPGNAREAGASKEMWLRPVGVVKNGRKEPSLVVRSGSLERRPKVERARGAESAVSELVVDDDLAGILDGIEGFSHLLVLYWAHLIRAEERLLTKVHPRGRQELPLVGIFGTRSPARPNPICVTPVRLLERRANILSVEGLDAVDGSPLVDIKPYVPGSYAPDEVSVPDWWNR